MSIIPLSVLQLVEDLRQFPAAQQRIQQVGQQITSLRAQAAQFQQQANQFAVLRLPQTEVFRTAANALNNSANQLEASVANSVALVRRVQSARPADLAFAQNLLTLSTSGPRFT